MRGGISGLPVANPIGERLPAVYAEDDFAQRMTGALDDVLAPVFATLDCLPDYFDPILAPPDFVEWLSGWVAFALDEGWTLAQRRALVANAVELHRWRGTARGLSAHVRLLTLGDVDIVDSGSCTFSERPGVDLPARGAHVEVKVRVPDPRTIDEPRLLAAIVEAVPAHVRVSLDVAAAAPAPRSATGRATASAKVGGSAPVRPASGSAAVRPPSPPVPPAAPPDASLTGQLKQPGLSTDGEAPPAAPSGPPASPPATGRVRGVARPGGPGGAGPGNGNGGGQPGAEGTPPGAEK